MRSLLRGKRAQENDDGVFAKQREADSHLRVQGDLLHGCMRGDVTRVQRAIMSKADISLMNVRGVTPLMLACSSSGKDALGVVKALLARGASVTEEDGNGWMPIHHACRNGKTEVVKYLISTNVDASKTTKDGKTSLMLATVEGSVDVMNELLKSTKVRSQVTDKDVLGRTALHIAVKEGFIEITKSLMERSARVNAKDAEGRQPLMVACEHGRLECAKVLTKKGAEVNSQDKLKRTALMYACLNGFEVLAKWLVLKKNADAYMEDQNGDSPFDVANDLGLVAFKHVVKNHKLAQEEDEFAD